jgi:hypothetical protein
MNTETIHEVTMKTEEGKMTFPQVVHELTEAGVESYSSTSPPDARRITWRTAARTQSR